MKTAFYLPDREVKSPGWEKICTLNSKDLKML